VTVPETQQITHYYDTTTAWFLRFGETRKTGAIHRAVSVPEYALVAPTDTVHHLIAHAIRTYIPQATVGADLGCGVGASLQRMRALLPQLDRLHGITISSVQAQIAQHRGQAVSVASYHDLPFAPASLDVVWAIESLVHSAYPGQFYAEVARCLRPGGILCIVDDMATAQAEDSQWVPHMKAGWQAPGLQTLATHQEAAQQVGLEYREHRDLTAGLRIRVLPDEVALRVAHYLPTWFPHALVTSTIGSMALQQALAEGSIVYQCVVFQKHG
jgi:SAM-dependent methyltransferase